MKPLYLSISKLFTTCLAIIISMLLLFISLSSMSQVIHYIGSFNSQGVPDYLVQPGDALSADFLDRIDAAVPEGYDVPTYHPSYLTNNFVANLEITATTDIFITFVDEGAGYKNVLGFYTYETTSPPVTSADIDTIFIVYPNVSKVGSGGGLVAGDKVNIGEFNAGTTIGFCIIANGYDASTNTVGSGRWTLFSNKHINPNTAEEDKQQVVVLYDSESERHVICFEDVKRPSGDKDFNDAIFYATASVDSAVQEEDIAGLPKVWIGAEDSDWFNPNNWNPAAVPDSSDNISIAASATYFPVVSGNVSVDAIVVEPGATLTFDESVVAELTGDLTSTSNQVINGCVKMKGNKKQHIFGDTQLQELTLETTDSVSVEGNLSVTHNLIIESGTLVTNNKVTLKGSPQKNACLIEDEDGEVVGNVTAEGMTSSASGYHYLCTPLQNQTLSDVMDDITLLSLGGNSSSVPFPNCWIYDETNTSPDKADGWVTPGSTAHVMGAGSGFALNTPGNAMIDFNGPVNTGTIIKTLTHTVSQGGSVECPPDGWHLIGNPYPCAIDWSKVILQNIDITIYVWNAAIGNYATYVDGVGANGGTGHIDAYQGFFVRTNQNDTTVDATVTFTDSMKIINPTLGVNFKTASSDIVRLKLSGNNQEDELVIRLNEESSFGFDYNKDAFKMKNSNPKVPCFASSVEGVSYKYSVNAVPVLENELIELQIEAGEQGKYEISMHDYSGFMGDLIPYIYDEQTGNYFNLQEGPVEVFLNNQEKIERYKFIFDQGKTTSIENLEMNGELSIFSSNKGFAIWTELDTKVSEVIVFSTMGELVFRENIEIQKGAVTNVTSPDFSAGTYVVKIRNENEVYTSQIVLY